MARIEVVGHILGDHLLIGYEQIKIPLSHSCRDLEGDVEQLAKAAVVSLGSRVVPERSEEFLGRPTPNFGGRGQLAGVDVNHSGVRLTQFPKVGAGLAVNLLDERQAVSPGFS